MSESGKDERFLTRREFLRGSAAVIASGILGLGCARVNIFRNLSGGHKMLEVGEGIADITPPLGIELAGFHRAPGNERVITGIRQAPMTRALVLRMGNAQSVIVALEMPGVSRSFAERVQKRIEKQSGIPAENVRICATHTHSMPTLCYFRQWGALPPKEYVDTLESRILQSVEQAKDDLAPAELYMGKEQVVGGNFNRASKTWKTDDKFTNESTDAERWLDTMLHALVFQRGSAKRDLLWYHFSCHAVCFTDGEAGPDWPGIVADKIRASDGFSPAFLQGHCGDVNPGPGTPWIGKPDETSAAIYTALHNAISNVKPVKVEKIQSISTVMEIPLDVALLKDQLDTYRADPSKCTSGEWVDAGFAEDWFKSMSEWDTAKTTHSTPISAMGLGDLGLVFHPAELYSYYGLDIRRNSPFENTLVVGYADDQIGYLPDPAAYTAREYSAVVVPKILGLPPFKPEAARELAAAAGKLLQGVA